MGSLKWFKSSQTEDETIAVSKSKDKKAPKMEEETLLASPQIKKRVVEDETIMSSPLSRELHQVFEEKEEHTFAAHKPKLSVVQRWSMKISQKKAQTILSTAFPLNDYEMESVRTQTLVSFHNAASVIEWPSSLKEKELEKTKPQDFLKILNFFLTKGDLSGQNRSAVTQLKNALIVRTKLLTEESIIINIINQGYRSFCHTLDRLAFLTSNKKINKNAWEYLYFETEKKLTEYGESFRKQILACKSCDGLNEILDKYTLKSLSIVKKYPVLQTIVSLKDIQKSYQKRPDQLVRILNRFLGAYGEVNIKEKLSHLLLTSEGDARICKEILKLSSLPDLLKKLEKLQANKDLASAVTKLLTLVRTYIEPGEKVSFTSFATSLNSFAPALSQKVLSIVRHGIGKELKEEVQKLMKSQDSALSRLLGLLKLLKNPRYEDPCLLVFGYAPGVLADKIQTINASVGPDLERITRHIISHEQVPESLITLIVEGKKAQHKASKW